MADEKTTTVDLELEFVRRKDEPRIVGDPPLIIHRDGRPRPFVPREGLIRFDAERTGRDIVFKERQVGMSTWEIIRSIKRLHERPHQNIWHVFPDERCAHIAVERLAVPLLAQMNCPMVARTNDFTFRLVRGNGEQSELRFTWSTKFRLAANTRSVELTRLVLDEAHFFPSRDPHVVARLLAAASSKEAEVTIFSSMEEHPAFAGPFWELLMDAIAGRETRWKAHQVVLALEERFGSGYWMAMTR